jgi:threonine/homoserine/homoserine lactone efflux protein
MNAEIFTALAAFAFVSSITPGPNNLLLMASGANYGFRRTVPHLLGVGVGFVFMIVLVGLGLVRIFDAYPQSYQLLKWFSVCYLLYLSWKIATAAPPSKQTPAGNPFTFLQAALFQWINPKAWAMALTAISVYAPTQSVESVLFVALVFGMINLPSVSSWTLLGQQMQRCLNSTTRLRVFNFSMAILLLATLYPVIVS